MAMKKYDLNKKMFLPKARQIIVDIQTFIIAIYDSVNMPGFVLLKELIALQNTKFCHGKLLLKYNMTT